MGEAPCNVVPGPRTRRASAHFRLPCHGRRKVLVVRLGGGGGGRRTRAGGRGLCLRRLKLRWLRRAMWRLAALCVAALSGPGGVPNAPPPWTGVDPYFAAPFVPAVLLRPVGQRLVSS